VTFSSGQLVGVPGLVVAKDGSVNGGDSGFIYRGTYNTNGQNLTAQGALSKHSPDAKSVLGPIDNYTLMLAGTFSPNNFTLSGVVAGHHALTIEIDGRKLSDVAPSALILLAPFQRLPNDFVFVRAREMPHQHLVRPLV
jgi:hypothetical protein